jgi:hypothetical protein
LFDDGQIRCWGAEPTGMVTGEYVGDEEGEMPEKLVPVDLKF